VNGLYNSGDADFALLVERLKRGAGRSGLNGRRGTATGNQEQHQNRRREQTQISPHSCTGRLDATIGRMVDTKFGRRRVALAAPGESRKYGLFEENSAADGDR
jgi:hypothetical protein